MGNAGRAAIVAALVSWIGCGHKAPEPKQPKAKDPTALAVADQCMLLVKRGQAAPDFAKHVHTLDYTEYWDLREYMVKTCLTMTADQRSCYFSKQTIAAARACPLADKLSDPPDPTVGHMRRFTTAMCRCKDATCAQKTNAAYIKWSTGYFKGQRRKGTKKNVQRWNALQTRYIDCRSAVQKRKARP